jgi:hypothetical protein
MGDAYDSLSLWSWWKLSLKISVYARCWENTSQLLKTFSETIFMGMLCAWDSRMERYVSADGNTLKGEIWIHNNVVNKLFFAKYACCPCVVVTFIICSSKTPSNHIRYVCVIYRSKLQSGLRRGSTVARLLGLRVRIPPGAWIFVLCVVKTEKRQNVG